MRTMIGCMAIRCGGVLHQKLGKRPHTSPHLIFRAPSGFSPLFCSVGLYARCHRWCPPCLIRRYRVVLVYSGINSKANHTTSEPHTHVMSNENNFPLKNVILRTPSPKHFWCLASRLVTVDAEPCWKRCASPSSQPEGTLCRKAKAPLRPCVRLSLLPTRSAGATCPTSEAGAASRRCNAGCPHQ